MGATEARDLPVPGRELGGIHQAMEFLPQANRVALGEEVEGQITADRQARRHHRRRRHRRRLPRHVDPPGRRARSPSSRSWPQPPEDRPAGQPWPTYPMTFRVSSAHEEGGDRVYAVSTQEFLGDDDGHVRALRLVEVGREVPADRGHRARDPGRAGALRDGLHRAREARSGRAARRRPRRARQRRARRVVRLVAWTASSSPATSVAASRSSCGRSPRGGRPRRPSTRTSPGRRRCRRRSRRPSVPSSSDGGRPTFTGRGPLDRSKIR